MQPPRLYPSAVVLLLCACGGPAAGDDGGAPIDHATIASGGDAAQALVQSVAIADSLFDFGPTLDPSMDAAANAAAIQANIEANLDGCGTVSLDGTSVTVELGAPPGCTLLNGVTASGTVTATVTSDGTTLSVALTFTDVTVNGISLSGSATFVTGDGSSFTVSAMLTSGGASIDADVTVTGAAGSFTVDGTLAVAEGGTTISVTMAGLVYALGDCYPSAGTITLVRGRITTTLQFSAATASTGEITVMEGRRSETATLPAYGECPSG